MEIDSVAQENEGEGHGSDRIQGLTSIMIEFNAKFFYQVSAEMPIRGFCNTKKHKEKEKDGVTYVNPYSRKGRCFEAAVKYLGK